MVVLALGSEPADFFEPSYVSTGPYGFQVDTPRGRYTWETQDWGGVPGRKGMVGGAIVTPSGERIEWVEPFWNWRDLRKGAAFHWPLGAVRVASVREPGRGRKINITGEGLSWRARRGGFLWADLLDGTERVLARSRGAHGRYTIRGDLDERTIGLVLFLFNSGVLTMTSRFELSLG